MTCLQCEEKFTTKYCKVSSKSTKTGQNISHNWHAKRWKKTIWYQYYGNMPCIKGAILTTHCIKELKWLPGYSLVYVIYKI